MWNQLGGQRRTRKKSPHPRLSKGAGSDAGSEVSSAAGSIAGSDVGSPRGSDAGSSVAGSEAGTTTSRTSSKSGSSSRKSKSKTVEKQPHPARGRTREREEAEDAENLRTRASSPHPNKHPGEALILAAKLGQLSQVKALVEAGQNTGPTNASIRRMYDKNYANEKGRTALYVAASHDQGQVVRYLVSVSVNVNCTDLSGFTPLHAAARDGSLDVARILIQDGEAHKNPRDDFGMTPLASAAVAGSPAMVSYLCSAHCDPSMRDNVGMTPMMLAASEGHIEVRALLADQETERFEREANKVCALPCFR